MGGGERHNRVDVGRGKGYHHLREPLDGREALARAVPLAAREREHRPERVALRAEQRHAQVAAAAPVVERAVHRRAARRDVEVAALGRRAAPREAEQLAGKAAGRAGHDVALRRRAVLAAVRGELLPHAQPRGEAPVELQLEGVERHARVGRGAAGAAAALDPPRLQRAEAERAPRLGRAAALRAQHAQPQVPRALQLAELHRARERDAQLRLVQHVGHHHPRGHRRHERARREPQPASDEEQRRRAHGAVRRREGPHHVPDRLTHDPLEHVGRRDVSVAIRVEVADEAVGEERPRPARDYDREEEHEEGLRAAADGGQHRR